MSGPVAVRVQECPDGTHPDGDVVYVAPTPSLRLGLEAQRDIREALGDGTILAERWLVTFVRYGTLGWNFHDEDGPVVFDVEKVLSDFTIASPVAEKCDELYGEAVTRPLLERLRSISRRGQTNGSTSATPASISKPRRRSSPATSAATKPSSG